MKSLRKSHLLFRQVIPWLIATLSACCPQVTPEGTEYANSEQEQLRLSAHSPARGLAIVIHGLNQRPSTMAPMVEALLSAGYHTHRVTLRGHAQADREIFSKNAWLHDLQRACSASSSRFPGIPTYIIAYSLGGLVATRAVDSGLSCSHVSRMILFAPALSLRMIVQTGYLLSLLPPTTLAVPNIAPRYYRRFSHTPLFWYRNTLALYSQTRTLSSPGSLAKIPTLIFANPRDELVSLPGLRAWLRANNLDSSWNINVIHPAPRDRFLPEHLVIDQSSLGDRQWNFTMQRALDFLQAPPNPL